MPTKRSFLGLLAAAGLFPNITLASEFSDVIKDGALQRIKRNSKELGMPLLFADYDDKEKFAELQYLRSVGLVIFQDEPWTAENGFQWEVLVWRDCIPGSEVAHLTRQGMELRQAMHEAWYDIDDLGT